MYQPWTFGAMLAAGTGLVAFTVKIQHPPSPPVLAPEPAVAVHVVPPPAPTFVAEPVQTSAFVEVTTPMVIEGRRHRAVARAEPQPAEPVVAEHPCSAWREIGPTHVVSGKPSGNLSVRELCQ